MALYDSENNKLLDTNDNVLVARSSFTIGTQTAKKVFVGENEVKAIYIGNNLVYEKVEALPQLSAPVISLDGDILSIEEVENAEYYDIYVDGVLEESVPAVDGYSGDILAYNALESGQGISTKIKFDTPPENDNDYDSYVDYTGNITGLTSYSNKTKIYIWGAIVTFVVINNVITNGETSYDNAVELALTGNYDIYLAYSGGGSN